MMIRLFALVSVAALLTACGVDGEPEPPTRGLIAPTDLGAQTTLR